MNNKSRISEESVLKFVNKMLANDDINSFLPDCIERKIYLSLITKILNIILQIFQDFEINLLNHTIKCSIRPEECK